jgi:hypothetical protein
MTSAIDSTVPTAVSATTASVRANFATAASEITALQATDTTHTANIATNTASITALQAGTSISVTATGATTAVTLPALQGYRLSPQMFGAVGDGTTDDTAAVALWWTYISTHNVEGYVPAGTYKLVGQVTWDIGATNRTKGVKVTGAGPRLAVFSLTTTSSPALLITNSNSPGDTFYCTFRDFGITTAVAGTGVRIGLATFADPFNSSTWDNLVINNTSTSASAIGLETNYLCNCHVNAVVNCGAATAAAAVKVNHSVFCEYRGAYDTALIGLNLATDYTYGCTFQAIDFETVGTCVQIDSANATKNLFLGGTFVYTGSNALVGNAGSSNLFLNPNISGAGSNISGSGIQTLIGGTLAGGALTVSSGGVAITGNSTITGTLGSLTGLTVASGGAAITGNSTITGTLGSLTGLTVASGGITVTSGSVATAAGDVTASRASGDCLLFSNSAAATTRGLRIQTATSSRWDVTVNSTAEGGANAGSDFVIRRYSDAGSSVDAPLVITRSTGVVTMADGLTITTGGLTVTAGGATVTAGNLAMTAGFIQQSGTGGLTAAGNSQGTALALTTAVNIVTTAAASTGVILPTAANVVEVIVINRGANTLSVYPPTSGQIDAAGTNVAVTIATLSKARYMKTATNQWYTV